jgi:hypothetical protein
MFLSVSGNNAQPVSKENFKDTVPRAISGLDIQGWLSEVEAYMNPAPDFDWLKILFSRELGN